MFFRVIYQQVDWNKSKSNIVNTPYKLLFFSIDKTLIYTLQTGKKNRTTKSNTVLRHHLFGISHSRPYTTELLYIHL